MTAMRELLAAALDACGWRLDPAADPRDADAYLKLLRALYATGRRDLPLGRLLEGHVDAVQIVQRYSSPDQVARLRAAIRDGALLGVWNAERGDPLVLDGDHLSGGKSHASGAGVLTHALVTARTDDGARLLLVDLDRAPPAIDRDWWHVTGMQRSETHLVHWDAAPRAGFEPIGAPGDYATEPYFSGGALRFAAVQAGGIAGIADRVRDHLVGLDRAGDPFQRVRLADLFTAATAAAGAVRDAADAWFATDGERRLAYVAAARVAVQQAGTQALAIARDAVGLPGMFVGHPLAAMASDLDVYLRQPAYDAQRLRVGTAVADGRLSAAL